MAEPHTSAAAGYALGTGVSFSQIIVFGARAEYIVAGVLVSIYISIVVSSVKTALDAFSAVMSSALMAAYLAPVVAHEMLARGYLSADEAAVEIACVAVLSAGGPVAIPLLLDQLRKKITGSDK